MKAVELKNNIYWVGGIDWDLRNFHGYLTQRGSTYNAYLIIDEKIVLIDTVKYYLSGELLKRISSVIDPSKIDYIISNHVEMDHSGSIPDICRIAKNAKIVTSANGLKGLKAHYKNDYDYTAVKTGDTLKIGKRELNFILTPMVHWPDNMLTYLPQEKILFSNDAFGQHIASSERFDFEYNFDIITAEAKKYYANIVLPYGQQVQSALKAAENLSIDIIAPSHGIIWKNHISSIISSYQKWSKNETENKALVIYDTMWGTTKKIAHAIREKFERNGIKADLFNLQFNHISDIMTELLTAKYVCVGSPTLNNNILPTTSAFLTYLKGLSPKNRTGLAFGSYGWGGQSVGIIEEQLKLCGFELLPSIKIQYVPDEKFLDEIEIKL
ncbi:MAG TPA: FprA family A-type flavoprotein [bacterium]|nr:FprA family A-type flavoprotein [bacterium]